MSGTVVAPALMRARPVLLPACHQAGCKYLVTRGIDDRAIFIHDGLGAIDVIEISDADLGDMTVDIWGEQVKPWIAGLHRKAGWLDG